MMSASTLMPPTADHTHHNVQRSSAAAVPLAPVLMRAEGLRKAFGGQVVLDGVDLELRQGEVILLRGENGSGKTTLLNILTGCLEPDAGSIQYLADGTPRAYRFPRHWWQELNPFDHFTPEFVAREGVGRTWQDIRLFDSQSLRDNIAVAEPGHPGENPLLAMFAPGASVRRETAINHEADAILARLGLAGREDSSADKISLGQSKRVAIARAVAAGARILFLDEPLAGLDRQGVNDVLSLLESLVADHQVTLIIIEHIFNQPHLHGLITTDWLLANGVIQRSCIDKRDSTTALSPLTNSSGTANPRPVWLKLLAGENTEIEDELLPRGALLTRIRRPGGSKHPLRPVLEIRDLIVKRGSRTVIGSDEDSNRVGFSLTLYEGEIAILQAPNGWGKSTLFAAICGLIKVAQGEVLLNGQPLEQLQAWDRARLGISALPSDHHTFPTLRTKDVLKLVGNTNASAAADLGELDNRVCSSLSGGERQKVALRALLSSTGAKATLLLDEPFAALDGDSSRNAAENLVSAHFDTCLITSPRESDFMNTEPDHSGTPEQLPPHTLELLARLSAKSAAGEYCETLPIAFSEFRLTIEPHVCPLLPSTLCYLSYLRTQNLSGMKVLDLGSGSGALSIAAVCIGAASVDAIDNLPQAIVCTRHNAEASGVADKIHAFESNGFSHVNDRYDLIVANVPIVHVPGVARLHDFGLYDEGWELHDHLLANYRKHLLPGGSVLICHVPLQSEWSFDNFESYLTQSGATFKVAFESFQQGLPWRLYSLS